MEDLPRLPFDNRGTWRPHQDLVSRQEQDSAATEQESAGHRSRTSFTTGGCSATASSQLPSDLTSSRRSRHLTLQPWILRLGWWHHRKLFHGAHRWLEWTRDRGIGGNKSDPRHPTLHRLRWRAFDRDPGRPIVAPLFLGPAAGVGTENSRKRNETSHADADAYTC